MRHDKVSICNLFDDRVQYLIPLFQRGYVWSLNDQILPLWEDLMDRANALAEHNANAEKVGGQHMLRKLRKHFLGAIVTGTPGGGTSKVVKSVEIIDGQQRLTTLQILLLAMRDVCADMDDKGLATDLEKLTLNPGNYTDAGNQLKVWPTNVGRDVMRSLFEAGSFDEVCKRFPAHGTRKSEKFDRPLMVRTYLFLSAMLTAWLRGIQFDEAYADGDERTIAHAVIRSVDKDNVVMVPNNDLPLSVEKAHHFLNTCRECFQIMSLMLEEEDDPQIIFETLNARGAPLQPSDLVRNFVFLEATRKGENVDALYDNFWRHFDERLDGGSHKGAKFWRQEQRQGRLKTIRLDLLLYHYASLRKCEDLKVAHVFDEFKTWWSSEARDIAFELGRLTKLAKHFEVFLQPSQATRFDWFCHRMKLLDMSTLTPLVFHFLEHHSPDSPPFIQLLNDLESYTVRRFVCGLTTKGYNRIFMKILSDLVKDRSADPDRVRTYLSGLQGDSQLWPTDDAFRNAWRTRALYQGKNTSKVRAILEALELAQRGSKQESQQLQDDLTVEHVLPQTWTPEKWPMEVSGLEGLRDQMLHSIGNLTLVTGAFNSSLSNESFANKRPEIVKTSLLMLNTFFQDYSNTDTWDEDQMLKRADVLFPIAKVLWDRPSV